MDHSQSQFRIGKVTITPFSKLALDRAGQKGSDFLNLHKTGNWGEITDEEKHRNDQIVESQNKMNRQILSAYTTSFNEMIWIVTRFDQNGSSTTVLLPHEYDRKRI